MRRDAVRWRGAGAALTRWEWCSWWYLRKVVAVGTTSGQLLAMDRMRLYSGFLKARKWLSSCCGQAGGTRSASPPSGQMTGGGDGLAKVQAAKEAGDEALTVQEDQCASEGASAQTDSETRGPAYRAQG